MFEKTIKRAIESCDVSQMVVVDHFREVTKMVALGSGSKRKIKQFCWCLENESGGLHETNYKMGRAYE